MRIPTTPRFLIQLSHNFREAVSPGEALRGTWLISCASKSNSPTLMGCVKRNEQMPLRRSSSASARNSPRGSCSSSAALAFLPRQEDSVPLDGDDQRRPRRERDAQLLFRGGQNFHQPRMIALVQARRAQQNPELPEEENDGGLGIRKCRANGNHFRAGRFRLARRGGTALTTGTSSLA